MKISDVDADDQKFLFATNMLKAQLTVTAVPQKVCKRASATQIQVAYIPPELPLISSCSYAYLVLQYPMPNPDIHNKPRVFRIKNHRCRLLISLISNGSSY